MSDGALYVIPTQPDNPHPLGRSVVNHDSRNRQFRALLAGADVPAFSKTWWTPPAFNQTSDNCTMETDVRQLMSTPNRTAMATKLGSAWAAPFDSEPERVLLYKESQDYDPYDGTNYAGTSSDAPGKLFVARGWISGYSWLFGVVELRARLRTGVAAAGVNWYTSMWETDAKGYIHVTPESGIAGGHEFCVIGWSETRRAFRCMNSWGPTWGDNGRFWITYHDMDILLQNDGDAHVLVP